MAFDFNKFEQSLGMQAGVNRIWIYTDSTQTQAQCIAANFFDDVNQNQVTPILNINDLIWICPSDTNTFVVVTAVTPHVTVAVFDAVLGAGAVGTNNIAALAVTGAKIANNTITSTQLALNTIQYAQVTITAAQFNGMYAAPKLLVAAGGANTMIIIDSITYEVIYGTAAFAAGGVWGAQYDSTVHGAGVGASATSTAATAFWAANSTLTQAGQMPSGLSSLIVNKGIYLSNLTGAFTTGDSVVKANVVYRVVTTTV